jgi:transcription elongation factor Elf1
MCGNDEFVTRTIDPSRREGDGRELNVCSKCGLVYDFHIMETFKGIAMKIPVPEEEPAE